MNKDFIFSDIAARPEFDVIREHEKNKSVIFYTINSRKRYEQCRFVGITSYLMSYEYIRKSLKFYSEEMLPEIEENAGVFMTDSGVFSFLAKTTYEQSSNPAYWERYIEEYVQFLYDNHQRIFCAANFDLDTRVGRDVVDRWNEKYFEPLHKYMEVVYVAHPANNDVQSFGRIKDYADKGYEYIGLPSNLDLKATNNRYFQLSKLLNIRYHGFGFTDYDKLMQYPFFSADSSTWTMGSRYGETHFDTGRDYVAVNRTQHHVRKRLKWKASEMGLDYKDIDTRRAKDTPVNIMNLHGWLRFSQRYTKRGNQMLRWSNPVKSYDIVNGEETEFPDFYRPLKERELVKFNH